MFSFFHRTSKIHMDCFINNKYMYETTPIVNAHKTYPDWWKNLPLSVNRVFDYNIVGDTTKDMTDEVQTNNNMKNCYGFLEFYKRGAVIESWTDFRFKTGPGGYKYFCGYGQTPKIHDSKQRGEGFKDYHHSKLSNPWIFKVNQEAKFLFTPATWNLEKFNFVIPQGVLNFDVTNIAHINIFLPRVKQEFEIPTGQPLVHLIPLSEKKLSIKNHFISEAEYANMLLYVGTSFYGWRRRLELFTRNKKREEQKCPFR